MHGFIENQFTDYREAKFVSVRVCLSDSIRPSVCLLVGGPHLIKQSVSMSRCLSVCLHASGFLSIM